MEERRTILDMSSISPRYLHTFESQPINRNEHIKTEHQRTICTVIGTLAVGRWAVSFGTEMWDWTGPQPAQAPRRYTICNSPSVNGQCTNFILFDAAIKG